MQRLGPYEVLGELGRGGMGAVYRARRGHEREVAVKVLLAPLEPEERARFEREARVLAGFQHPNVIAVHDAGITERGLPYLVLPLLQGSLHDRLRQGPLPSSEAAAITRKLAQAVAYAHARQVLHRDLKPHNVLFDAAGEPVLTDFGLAQTRDDRITATGEVLGTPGYMSPEQAHGARERIGTASDVYGLGATLYAMLTGGAPFVGGSALAVLGKVVSEAPSPLPSEVDSGLAAICMRCLAKSPDERFGHADDLALALEVWAEEAGSPAEGARLGWLVPALVVAVGVAAVGMGLAVLWQGSLAVPGPVATRGAPSATRLPSPIAPAPSPSATVSATPPPTVSATPSPSPSPSPTAGLVSKPEDQRAAALRSKAGRALQRKEWRYAGELLDEALKSEDSWIHRMMRAKVYEQTEDVLGELAAMRRAVELNPTSSKLRALLANRLGELGDPVGHARELERLWVERPGELPAMERKALIRLWVDCGRYESARGLLVEEMKRSPEDLELVRLYGECLWYLLQHKEAQRVLRSWAEASGEPAQVERFLALARTISALADQLRRDPALKRRVILASRPTQRSATEGLAALETVLASWRGPLLLERASHCALNARDLERAIRYCEEALSLCTDPGRSASLAGFGAVLHLSQTKNVAAGQARAFVLLNRAVDLAPKRPGALLQRGALWFRWGFWEEAFADFRRATKLGGETVRGLVGRGWSEFAQGRYDAALAIHRRALTLEGKKPHGQAEEGIGVALVALKRFAEARPVLDQALERKPNLHYARFARAKARRAAGDERGAIEDQLLGLSLLSRTHPERRAREDELKQLRVRDRLRKCGQAMRAERLEAALAHASAARDLERSAETLVAYASVMWGLTQRAAAFEAQAEAVALAPKQGLLRRRLGHMLRALGDRSGALRELEAEFRLAPESFDAARRLELVQERTHAGRWVDALALADRSLARDPDQPHLRRLRHSLRWWLFRDRPAALEGLKRLGQGAGEEATEARKEHDLLERLSRPGPAPSDAAAAFRSAGTRAEAQQAAWKIVAAHVRGGRIEEARRYLSRAIDLGKARASPLVIRAQLRFDHGDYELAFEDYRRAQQAKPDDARAWVGRGWEHYWRGRYREALAEFSSALPDSEGSAEVNALEGQGVTLVAQGRLQEAIPVLARVLRDRPAKFMARFAQAEVFWVLGKRADAIKDQQAGLAQLHPTHPDRPARLRELRRMNAASKRAR